VAKVSLKEKLFDEPYRFEFFQAVRLFASIYRDKKRVGSEALPAEEIVRFRSRVSLDFPSSEVHQIRTVEDPQTGDERREMLVNFMGMIGPSGVLPTHYTELVIERIRQKDTAMWAFLDIFTHRAVSLFYRAWEKYRFPVGYERGEDEFTGYLFDIIGLGTEGLRGRMSLPDESLLPYAGLISQKPHSSNSLENILSDYFGVKAKIEQFFGQWLELGKNDLSKLGDQNSELGVTTVIGSRVWDQQSKFRIKVGPIAFKQYTAFLPNGSAFNAFRSIVNFIVGTELDFDVQLVLKKEEVPSAILTTRAMRKPMLGWTTFLKTQPFKKDDEQLVLQPA
jgi:type VI secretion system protein ImpH